jgi:uncharacterized protein (TIGR03083 family)
MPRPSGEEIASHYLAAHRRIRDLAAGLTQEQADSPVPATPGWTVHDVLAHLAAIPTDAMAGRITGIPTPDVTQRQVDERHDRSIAELLDEWSAGVEPMAEGARVGLVPPNLAVDAVTHEQDVRGALGLPRVPDDEAIAFSFGQYAFGAAYRIREAGLPPLTLHLDDVGGSQVASGGQSSTSVRTTRFELFRALAGRRSRRQVAAYTWTGDPEPYLDLLCVFGPLPAGDVHDG